MQLPYKREFIRFKDDLYDIVRKYAETKVKVDKIDDLRQSLTCDITLKKDGLLFFCRKIEEAQIVEQF